MNNQKDNTLTIEAVPDTQPPLVKVLSPNGGEIYQVGSTVTIRWDSLDERKVVEHRIRLSRNGVNGDYDELIVSGLGGDVESYDWQVTGLGTSRASIKVIAFDEARNRGFDTSDTPFIIQPTK